MSETSVETIEEIKEIEEVKEDAIIENPYLLKKISSKDVFIFSTILKQIGYSELKECFNSDDVKKLIRKPGASSVDEIGLSIMLDVSTVVISNLASAEDSIYQLLSHLSGKTKAEIANLDAEIFIAMIIDVFKQDGFINFFKAVARLLK
nr:MAG TPA: hypothetical protein [Bacteriophage sp.]